MSLRADKILALAGLHHEGKTSEELIALFSSVLDHGMHGLCFSPYIEGQKPGEPVTEAQIRRRMAIVKPYTKWIRTFSCTEGNELIPKIAKEFGIKTLVGAWLGKDDSINKKEIDNLIKIAEEGYVDIAAVGNEVMYRGDLCEEELLGFISQVKSSVPDMPLGYVDAYYEFEQRPNITQAIDIVLANCYPYWEGCHSDYSLFYMKDMFARAMRAAKGKKVIISETGWPSQGTGLHGAMPSKENFMRYFINAQKWSQEEQIELFFFSSFDESWKTGDEGDVGAYWGIWDKEEVIKFKERLLQ